MVQRKVPNKLGIQVDHVISDKQLGNLKPSSQHQDGKNRGADLKKKKMKKSRSIKRSELECLRSPALTRDIPQPGKPPPLDFPATAATPQKQFPIRASDGSPNYMKPTSCSDARKERTQVSSRNSQVASDGKSPIRKNSNNLKLGSASGNKPARSLTRTSSLKLVRTLTKSPSFKPARASTKKCSQVVLCDNLNAQRATCSSTLKDSKFPTYLTLNPGGTESEGTSATKVCHYTYCSLNGHHHSPLPPLKCFLSARRRMLKTQKSIKLGCLSPRRAKPSDIRTKEIDTDTARVSIEERPAIQEPDLNGSVINPTIQEQGVDFFIEIYVKNFEDTAETVGGCKHNGEGQNITDASVDGITPSIADRDDTAAAEHDAGQNTESLSTETLHSEIKFEDNLDEDGCVISTKMDTTGFYAEEGQNRDGDVYLPSSAQQATTSKCLSDQSGLEVYSPASIGDTEGSDMEWEEGPYYAPYSDDEVNVSAQTNNESDLQRGFSWEMGNSSYHDEPIFKSDDIVSSCFEEIPADEAMEELFDKENVDFEGWSFDSSSVSDDLYQNQESDESIQVSNNQEPDKLPPCYHALEELTATEERDGKVESDIVAGTLITLIPVEEPVEEQRVADGENQGISESDDEIPRVDLQPEDAKTKCISHAEDEASADSQENESLQDDDASVLLSNQELDCSHDSTEKDQAEASQNTIEVYPSDADIGNVGFTEEVSDGSLLKTEDSDNYQNCQEQELNLADAGKGTEENEQADEAKLSVVVPFDLLQGFSEANQETTKEDDDERQLDAIAKDESNQGSADEGLPAETQNHLPDEESQINHVVEDQNHPEKDQDAAEKFKILRCLDSQDLTDSGAKGLRLTENGNQEVDKMEVEERTESDADETCLTAKVIAVTEMKSAPFHAGSKSNQEMHQETCKNSRGTIRCKRLNEDCEDPRKFNPREPNYLPMEPEPESEKVDLRHQMMDDRKNAEEWMLDHALQRTVTKLAPARKRKVALLVEAFETVMPIPKYEIHRRHSSPAFTHARPIQACS